MTDPYAANRERLHELLADQALGQLSVEDRAELERLAAEAGPGDLDLAVGELLVAIDAAGGSTDDLPSDVRRRLAATGARMLGTEALPSAPVRAATDTRPRSALQFAMAAGILLAGAAVAILAYLVSQQHAAIDDVRTRLAEAEAQAARQRSAAQAIEEIARERQQQLARLEKERDSWQEQFRSAIAEAERTTEALARTERDLQIAQAQILSLGVDFDEERLREQREVLAQLPTTRIIEWQPLEWDGEPPAQTGVTGQVVWNPEFETGILTFRGLEVNDPEEFVYQIWVIDERGIEQRVSAGLFNATEDGEVIVEVAPSLPIGRVQLFAVTMEDPGGVAVPTMERSVVVAPAGES